MSRKVEKSSDRLEPREKGEAQLLRRAEGARKLREAPDYSPRRSELVKDLRKDGIEADTVPEWKEKSDAVRAGDTEMELERRINEADKVWQECGECRSDFAREFGVDTHRRMEEKIRQEELAKGRREGPETFDIERTIVDRDGREHRPDFWDHEAKVIDDIKPVHRGETVGELIEKHDHQLLRYTRAAKETTGEEIREVGIRPYPGIEQKDAED